MSLSRTHIAFLGIISIFTGLIAPGTGSSRVPLSYLMTDAAWISYLILFGLIGAFLLASLRSWRYYRMSVILIIIGIVSLAFLTYLGRIGERSTGAGVSGFSWGWVFLIIGSILLIWSYRERHREDELSKFSDTIDTIIGMMGGFALACIGGIIVLSSFSYFSGGRNVNILESLTESGSIITLSGEIHSYGQYRSMPSIRYERARDELLISVDTASGKEWKLFSDGKMRSGVIARDHTPLLLGSSLYTVDDRGYAYSGKRIILGSRISKDKDVLVYKSGGLLNIESSGRSRSLDYRGILGGDIISSEDGESIGWIVSSGSVDQVVIDGKTQSGMYGSLGELTLSPHGKNHTALLKKADTISVIRDQIVLGTLPPTTITGSYLSNGINISYVNREEGGERFYYNFEAVGNILEDIRETFLEKDGTSYAYFGRPKGDDKWCLFTRYKGNICGLEGYMDPRIGADGGSIIYAGKKDGKWSIYRNTDIIVTTTYDPIDNSRDYAFYDLTNPRTYLFIEYDKVSETYSYRKNSIVLPGRWKDVSTEVAFGYDNHIITTAKDSDRWQILEL